MDPRSPVSHSLAFLLRLDSSSTRSNFYISQGMNRTHLPASMSPPLNPVDMGMSNPNVTVYNAFNHNALAFTTAKAVQPLNWGMLGLTVIIVCTAVGNLLVCLAVCWEKRLQNMTNYFLMSLAIADFLVSLLVMPLGMVVEIFGHFPMSPEMCVLWVSSDVLMCSASIWHMCTMSMDRYFTLNYPLRYGRNKTRRMVAGKIMFVWVVSLAIALPICIYGFVDSSIVYNNGACVPVLKSFVILGSIFAFYIPLLIMLVTYVLTIRILWRNQQHMQQVDRSSLKPRLAQLTAQCTGFAIPKLVSSLKKPTRVDRKTVRVFRSEKPDESEYHTQYLSDSGITNHSPISHRPVPLKLQKKWSSLPTFRVSILLDKESELMINTKRSKTCKHRNDEGSSCVKSLRSSKQKLVVQETFKPLGLQHLRPPSTLGHSGIFTSPGSSVSTMESTLHSPCAYSECGELWDGHSGYQSIGKRFKYSRQFKSPTSLSCRSFSTYLSLKSSDNSLFNREFCTKQQKEEQGLKNCLQSPGPNNIPKQGQLQKLKNQEINQIPEQYYHQLKEHNQHTDSSGCTNNLAKQVNSLQQDQSCRSDIPSSPKTAIMKYNHLNDFPSSVSTPFICVSHDSCVGDSLVSSSVALLKEDLVEHSSSNCVSKHFTSADSRSASTDSTLIRSKSEVYKSTGNKFTRQCLELNRDKIASREYSPKGSLRRKRFSKRSKKNRKPLNSQKSLNTPDRDPLLYKASSPGNYSKQTDGFLHVPTQNNPWQHHADKQTCRFGGMTAAHSDANIAHTGKAGQFGCREGHGCYGTGGMCFCSIPLDNRRPELDYQSMEWGRRYFQIQDEMDRCLSGEVTDSSDSEMGRLSGLFTNNDNNTQSVGGCSRPGHASSDVIDLSQSATSSPVINKRVGVPTTPILLRSTGGTNDSVSENEREGGGYDATTINNDGQELGSTSSSSASNKIGTSENLGICIKRKESVEGNKGDDDDDDDDDSADANNDGKDYVCDIFRSESRFSSRVFDTNEFQQGREYTPDFSSTDGLLDEVDSVSLVRSYSLGTCGLESKSPSHCVTVCLQPPSPKSNLTFLHRNEKSPSVIGGNEDNNLVRSLEKGNSSEVCSNIRFCNDAFCDIGENRTISTSGHQHDELSTCDNVFNSDQKHSFSSLHDVSHDGSCNKESTGTKTYHNVTNRENTNTTTQGSTVSNKVNGSNQTPLTSKDSTPCRIGHTTTINMDTPNTLSPCQVKDTLSFPTGSSYSALNGETVISSDGEMTYEETDDTLDSEHNSNALKLRRPRVCLAQTRYQKRQQSTGGRSAESTGKMLAKRKRPSFKKTLLRIHRGRAPDTMEIVGGKTKHFLSKKTASNERKASKVLGIIFMVFVTLWTPFFTVNILSATCESCITSVTEEMMALFLWMGYIASLANPIIYTMFNTAFRRTFIRILTCKIRRSCGSGGGYGGAARSTNDGGGTTGYNHMSYTTMLASERRSTMTALLKDESR